MKSRGSGSAVKDRGCRIATCTMGKWQTIIPVSAPNPMIQRSGHSSPQPRQPSSLPPSLPERTPRAPLESTVRPLVLPPSLSSEPIEYHPSWEVPGVPSWRLDHYSFPRTTAEIEKLVEEANCLHALTESMNLAIVSPVCGRNQCAAPVTSATCVACMENEQNVTFLCGHLCLCVACAQKLVSLSTKNSAKCPVCRAESTPILLRQP